MNRKPASITGINAILAGSFVQCRHILFLYTSHVNKYAILESFFAMSKEGEKLLYITQSGFTIRFEKLKYDLSIVHLENIDALKKMDGKLRILMDTDFIDGEHEKLEEYFNVNKNTTVLCMYDITRLQPESIQKLAASHDRLILNTPNMTVLSDRFLEKLDVADATIERFVKDYLDIVVLALIASKPMCGTDILDIIHRDFNVLLSPGTIYPLLHRLNKEGLLECECRVKKKVYKPATGSKASIRSMLDEHVLANEFLNSFLKSTEVNRDEYA